MWFGTIIALPVPGFKARFGDDRSVGTYTGGMGWRLLEAQAPPDSPAMGVAWDEALLRVGTRPTLRLWINRPCLVLGRFDVRLPRLAHAVGVLGREGVALVRRSSGGTAVWHDATVLNVSVVVPKADAPAGVHETFESLGAGMVAGLRSLGLEAGFGRVPGTYCDGPHNLVVGGRKVAGLSQARKRGTVLVHASVLVGTALDEMHERIERFYTLAGRPRRFERAGVTTLGALCGAGMADARAALAAGYERAGIALQPATAAPAEREAARRLAAEIRLDASSPELA